MGVGSFSRVGLFSRDYGNITQPAADSCRGSIATPQSSGSLGPVLGQHTLFAMCVISLYCLVLTLTDVQVLVWFRSEDSGGCKVT